MQLNCWKILDNKDGSGCVESSREKEDIVNSEMLNFPVSLILQYGIDEGKRLQEKKAWIDTEKSGERKKYREDP